MAFEADYGASAVLKALCVARKARFLGPGGCWATGDLRPPRIPEGQE